MPVRAVALDLRDTAATFVLTQGYTLEDVKNLLGHSSITLTSNTATVVGGTTRKLEALQRPSATAQRPAARSDPSTLRRLSTKPAPRSAPNTITLNPNAAESIARSCPGGG